MLNSYGTHLKLIECCVLARFFNKNPSKNKFIYDAINSASKRTPGVWV